MREDVAHLLLFALLCEISTIERWSGVIKSLEFPEHSRLHTAKSALILANMRVMIFRNLYGFAGNFMHMDFMCVCGDDGAVFYDKIKLKFQSFQL